MEGVCFFKNWYGLNVVWADVLDMIFDSQLVGTALVYIADLSFAIFSTGRKQ